MWEAERDEMGRVQQLKGEIDRVNIEIQVCGLFWWWGCGGVGCQPVALPGWYQCAACCRRRQ